MSERLKVILDTNVFIDALLGCEESMKVVDDALDYCDVCFSQDTFNELRDLVTGERFVKTLNQDKVSQFLDGLQDHGIFHDPQEVLDVSSDPDDDMFFELASEVGADVIISQDLKGVLRVAETNGDYRTAHPIRFLKDLDLSFKTRSKPPKSNISEAGLELV